MTFLDYRYDQCLFCEKMLPRVGTYTECYTPYTPYLHGTISILQPVIVNVVDA